MRANDVRSDAVVRHGAYVALRASPRARQIGGELTALADRLGLRNEIAPGDDHPANAFALLRRVTATPADIADDELVHADAIVHVAAPDAGPVTELCGALTRLLGPDHAPRIIGGVVRQMLYTGNAMFNFSYAHRVLQQPGGEAPNAFLAPLSKTAAWWQKDWMERHTYFLPRYDDGRMTHQGHTLASAAGIPHLMRRTYKSEVEPAPAGGYDFVSYFECADAAVPVFHDVCAALRDVKRNPEWAFVREGPLWHGRRVATWADLFA